MSLGNFSSLALDVGGVLLFYSASNIKTLTPRQISNALDSPIWHDYERGKISKKICYDRICRQFGFDPNTWIEALDTMRKSLHPNVELIDEIKRLKLANPQLKVVGLSNIPAEDFQQLKPLVDTCGIFDEFYASCLTSQRKPDVACYERFLEDGKISPETCVFVDGRIENVVVAQSLGFRSLHFNDTPSAVTTLRNLFGDPVSRGLDFLSRNAKKLFCETDTGEIQPDNYSQLTILEHTGNRDLVTLEKTGPTWNYFIGEPVFLDTVYPDDSDTTSLAMLVLDDITPEEEAFAVEQILSHLSPDGLPYCWLQTCRPRFCHVICANVFRYFTSVTRSISSPRFTSICAVFLQTEAYLLGTRYYDNPGWFLFLLSDVCGKRSSDKVLSEMRSLLTSQIQDRMGCDRNIFGAALRSLAAQALGIENKRDVKTLLETQQIDGGWERQWLWKYGKEAVKIGSRGVVTAMAVRAIKQAREDG
ncbi:hypothetical protein CEP52_006756 [Fusarium oligoseptatum]|uniref:Uncharacterized protein n=1 Tax=Fusarium oligoseptatum TaxID=2604345 RepID=A0A428TRM1_9HYPO|nr:hypothetical protein CEP52_006756 [Fusarium oligoseptatum]